jgi:acyl-coenzyme A synthetase/AMP-(fatty) acid ligase
MIAEHIQTVHAAFAATMARWPQRDMIHVLPDTAVVYDIAPGALSYAAAVAEVDRLAAALEQAGYGAGHRVMLLMENRPAFFLWWLALNRIGASVVPVNPDLRTSELTYMIGHAEPALAVVLPGRVADLRAAADQAGVAMAVIAPDKSLPAPRPNARVAFCDGSPCDHEAALLYTSGTTGQPKGCILTNTYFLMAGRWYAGAGGLCALHTDGERMITPLPVFHMNAMAYSFMAMIAVGGCLTVLDRFHPRAWWANVRDSGATCLHYLGVMPSMLMGAPESAQDRTHSVRFGFGAGVDPKLHAAFEDRFGFPLVEAWAMTETGAGAVICANQPPRRVGESCLGRPGPEVEIRIIDEAGQDTGGAPGELLVRHAGPDPRLGFFAGYYKNAAATYEAWEGGWFHTGDIVRQDADGAMFFVDRKKNVIRRSGENIAAVEVESILLRHPAITGAAVTAVPDDVRGDEVFACLVVNTDPTADLAREIADWGLHQMAYYKVPGYIAFVHDLPLTATQKLQRAQLKALAASLLIDPATHDLRPLKKRTAA